MILKKIKPLLFGFLLVSCNGLTSELDTAYIEDPRIFEKPRCHFKAQQNCWTRSLELLMNCVDTVEDGSPEVLTPDMRFCRNSSGKLIEFLQPLQLVGQSDSIDFNVYNNKTRCFRFRGSRDSFVIDKNPYGTLKVSTLSNGDTQVSCLFGESFTITSEIKEKGCHNQKASLEEYLPQSVLEVSEVEKAKKFIFGFSGLAQEEPLFRCELGKK